MKRVCICILLITLFFNCKSDKKENSPKNNIKPEINKFESKLIDLRDVNQQFTSQLKVNKFGVQKMNDSTSSFVFKLDPLTEASTVKSYSFGIRGFSMDIPKPYKASYSPFMKTIEDEKYIILKNKSKNIKYFDSLYVFIYERKNWKGSGKLGDIKIRDILIED